MNLLAAYNSAQKTAPVLTTTAEAMGLTAHKLIPPAATIEPHVSSRENPGYGLGIRETIPPPLAKSKRDEE